MAPPWTGYQGLVNRSIQITYDDPLTYKGPVIRGWEPFRDRNATVYLKPQENSILLNPFSCRKMQEERLDLVIIQHSAPSNFRKRMANRKSWMHYGQM